MQRLQFWKRKARVSGPKDELAADTLIEAVTVEHGGLNRSEQQKPALIADDVNNKDPGATELTLYDPDYASIEGTETNSDIESAEWGQRHSRLSFETFKGPHSGSDPDSSCSHSPDSAKSGSDTSSTRGIPTRVNRNSSFEVIYSQVNKNKSPTEVTSTDENASDTSGRLSSTDDQTKPNPVSDDRSTPVPDSDDSGTLITSFDDVLANFKLSFTDLMDIYASDNPVTDQNSPAAPREEMPKPPEPDIVPNVMMTQEAYIMTSNPQASSITSNPQASSATPNPLEGHPVDLDLMMSDEIIFRARKKSVTFNDIIQERPVSLGESDTTLDESRTQKEMDQRPLANDITFQHANGTLPQNKDANAEILADLSNNDDQEINTIMENAKHVITSVPVTAPAHVVDNINDEVISMTSFDAYENEEEDLLQSDSPKVKRLVKTRTALIMLTWLCLGIMVDMTTCNFPITQQTLGVSIELLSRAHVVHGAGNLLAAVFLGVVCTYSSHDLFSWIIAGLLTLSMALVALPWCASLETVYSAYGVVGIGEMLVLAGTVMFVMMLWEDRRRDNVFHLLFMFQAVGSATVPQISHHVGHIVSNWTIPGLYGDLVIVDLTNGHTATTGNHSDEIKKEVGDILRDMFQLRIPSLVPLYCVVAGLGVVCSLLMCAVLGVKNIQLIKRREYVRRANRIRRQKLKRQIRLVNHPETKANGNSNGTQERVIDQNGKCVKSTTSDMAMILTRIQEMRENGSKNSHTEQQLVKLLEYATLLQTQKIVPKSVQKFVSHHETMPKETKWLQGYQNFGIGTQMYLYVFFTIASGLTMVYSQFLYLYAHEHMTLEWGYEDTVMFSLYWASAAIARLAAIPVSKVLSANALMIVCLVTNISSSAIMITYADRYPMLLWLFSGLLGASMGPVIPGAFTWANSYYNLKAPKVIGLCFGFWSLGSMVLPWVCGFVVGHWGLPAMFYMTISTAGLAFILYIPILVTMSKRRQDNCNADNVTKLPTRTYL